MDSNYKILIDVQEYQKRILDVMTSEEIDKYFNCTVFNEKEDKVGYKSAMIHGMCIASLLTTDCDLVIAEERYGEKHE